MKSRFLKFSGYSSFFFFAFTVSLYLTFPMQTVKGTIISTMEDAMGKGKQGRHGTDPVVSFSSIDLWRLSGVSFERLSLQMGSREPDPGPTFDFDELRLRVGLLSLLTDYPEVSFDAALYDGEVGGDITVTQKGEMKKIALAVDGVNLSRIPVVLKSAGVPTSGQFKGNIDLNFGKNPSKEANGKVDLSIRGLSFGPGELEVPIPGMAGGLTVPNIDMGELSLKADLKNGKAENGLLAMKGKDFQAELKPTIFLNNRLGRSRLNGDGWFSISEKFLKDNSKFETLLSFAAPLKKAKDKEGRYHFNLKGTLASPSAKLARPKKGKRDLSKKRPRKRPKKRAAKARKKPKKKKAKKKPAPPKEEPPLEKEEAVEDKPAPTEDPPAEDLPAEDAPAEDAPTEDAPAEEGTDD